MFLWELPFCSPQAWNTGDIYYKWKDRIDKGKPLDLWLLILWLSQTLLRSDEIFALLPNQKRNEVNIYKNILHTIYYVSFEMASIPIHIIEYKE